MGGRGVYLFTAAAEFSAIIPKYRPADIQISGLRDGRVGKLYHRVLLDPQGLGDDAASQLDRIVTEEGHVHVIVQNDRFHAVVGHQRIEVLAGELAAEHGGLGKQCVALCVSVYGCRRAVRYRGNYHILPGFTACVLFRQREDQDQEQQSRRTKPIGKNFFPQWLSFRFFLLRCDSPVFFGGGLRRCGRDLRLGHLFLGCFIDAAVRYGNSLRSRSIQGRPKLLHRLETAVGLDTQTLEKGLLLGRSDCNAQLAGEDQVVLADPIQSAGRGLSGQAVIDRGTERINVCPRALTTLLILLQRRITVLE